MSTSVESNPWAEPAAPAGGPVLSVRDLCVTFPSEAGRVDAVRGVSFDLHAGRTLAIVGESGSGKSVTSLAIMGLLPDTARVTGSVMLEGSEILGLSDKKLSDIRGKKIAMVFQDPLSSLTPVFSVGDQIVEALRTHDSKISKQAAWKRAVELLDLVGIPNPSERVRSFPHEFSGGMRQRVVIAIAIANDPDVIIADEPTTALDVTVQAQILDVLDKAQRETGAAVIMITHDMGVVAATADDVVVMYAGKPVEQAPVREVFRHPQMPYTVGLLGAIPRLDTDSRDPLVPIKGNPPLLIDLPAGCPFAPRCPVAIDACRVEEPELRPALSGDHRVACIRSGEIRDGAIDGRPLYPLPERPEGVLADVPRDERPTVLEVKNLTKVFPLMKGSLFKRRVGSVHAVNGLDFEIKRGETLAIVGESGCGKTTTLLEIMSLLAPENGELVLDGTSVGSLRSSAERRELRRNVQMVFQDPMGALDPRLTVQEIIAEPLTAVGEKADAAHDRVTELMALVGLDPTHAERFPGAFSGGQRQRIGIARALATNPKLLVLDEPVSALDVSIQAGVINLLDELQARLGLSYLFVAHDLSVVRHLADRVAVMYLGRFVEHGDVDKVFADPQHPYTQALLSAIPVPDPDDPRNHDRIVLKGDLPSPTDDREGCRFAGRCPLRATLPEADRELCTSQTPPLHGKEADHVNACHFR
ncbi:ABC transporter ATP-binding protein [Mariniluteicoccus flavus]